MAQKNNLDLIRGIDFVDYFLEFKEEDFRGYAGSFRLARLLKQKEIDCLIALNPKKEFHLASFLAGIPLRVGYDRKWGFCLNRKIRDEKHLAQKHEIEYNIDLVRLICSKVFLPNITLPIGKKEDLGCLDSISDRNQKYIVIHPFTSNPLKSIAFEFWVNLAQRIKERFANELVLIGEETEREQAERLKEILQVKDVVGKLSLPQLATFLKYNCKAFIGLDSGPLHLASLLDIPVVGLFTVSNPARWGAWGKCFLNLQEKTTQGLTSQLQQIISFIENSIQLT